MGAMNPLDDTHVPSTRRREWSAGLAAIAMIAVVSIAIVLALRAGFGGTTTGGIVLGCLAASGLLALKRASWRARRQPSSESRPA
jgi:hypothetical protein